MITLETFKKICPHAINPEQIVEALNEYAPRFYIDTPKRKAMFLAQCAHECAEFTKFKEGLNYSATGLRKTWPSRFPNDNIAFKYARQPRAIANYVYAGRGGNGSEASGDGFKYSGKGCIQLTFKNTYAAFEKDTGIKVLDNPDILTQMPEAVISALWFWDKGNSTGKSLNAFADKDDIRGSTKIINGGYIGIDERKRLYAEFLKVVK